MSEIEQETAEKQGEGGGGSQGKRKKRKSRALPDYCRCKARTEKGKRCEAARMKHSVYCVFHDPKITQRRQELMFPIPYEHPDQLQWLLRDAVEDLKSKKLSGKEAYALGYLVTLLMQNQPRVEQERQRLNNAPFMAEVGAAVDQWFVARAELKRKEREAEEREEEGRD